MRIKEKRIWAAIIDFSLLTLIHAIVSAIFIYIAQLNNEADFDKLIHTQFKITLISTFVFIIYTTIDEFITAQTIGKRILKIKVLREDGEKLKIHQALLRNVFRLIDYFMLIGLILIIIKNRRLADYIVHSNVTEV